MKFSYPLIKKLVPGVKSKGQIIDTLNFHSYETEDAPGDTFEVKLPANRFSDSASHIGVAREVATALNLGFKESAGEKVRPGKTKPDFSVTVAEKKLCPRYVAWRFNNIKVKDSPAWLTQILKDCGLRPINNVVDIMNYAMLLTGQPLHAFDFDKLEGGEVKIRMAKGEAMTTIDGRALKLGKNVLVIADKNRPIALAGIKGGKDTEVDEKTKRILVEAASFEPSLIYRTSKELGLSTDASQRFSHNLSLELPLSGIAKAAEMLVDLAGARPGSRFDSYLKQIPKRILKFDIEKFNKFIGTDLSGKEATAYLKRLGFKSLRGDEWEVPPFRTDVENHEDLFEEVARMYGYGRIPAKAPEVALSPSGTEDRVILKDKIRHLLQGFGFDEVYTYSMISVRDAGGKGRKTDNLYEVSNPISEEFQYLRPTLEVNLAKVVADNFRFSDTAKIFEIGNTFRKIGKETGEQMSFGVVFADKKEERFFELKGILDELFKKVGLTDYNFEEGGNFLKLESNGEIFGFLKNAKVEGGEMSFAEINFDKLAELVEGEFEYEPLPKYPSVVRDISIRVPGGAKIGDIIQEIQDSNLKLIEDVDLVDEYKSNMTLRIVFQSEERTLTAEEVNREMTKIQKTLETKFGATIR